MRKPILLTLLLALAVLTAQGQNCNQVVIHNGMSSYRSASSDGVNISASTVTSGSDTMAPPPGCPPFYGGQPPGSPRHTAISSVTITSTSNQLQNPAFTSGTAGWQWQQDPGGGGGWSYVYAGRPNGIGNGYTGMFSGTGTAAIANLQHILVVPGNAVTASVWGLGEPGALGQALLRVDWYGGSGNLISVSNSPTAVTNNYVWTQLRFSATAPAGAAYAVVDFAIIGKTTTTGRWFVYGFTATVGQTTTSSYTGCWDCYLSARAAVSVPVDDLPYDVTMDSRTECSSAGEVFYQSSDQKVPNVYVNAGGNTPYGVTPNITATVSYPTGPAPTGTVDFSMEDDNGDAVVDPDKGERLDSSGNAKWNFSMQAGPISVGNYTAWAMYSGDANYVAGVENSDALAIIPADSVVTMSTCPAASVTAGQSVTFKVKIALAPGITQNEPLPLSPGGTVTLTGTSITPSPSGGVSGFIGTGTSYATISLSLSKGSYTIQGQYSGDSNYVAHTSNNACVVTAQ